MIGTLTARTGAVATQRMASAGATIATNIILANELSRATNGLVQKAFIVSQIAVLAGAFGIQTSLFYFLPRLNSSEKRSFVLQSGIILASIGTLLSLLIFLCAPLLGIWFRTPEVIPLLKWAALAVLFALPAMIADPLFVTENRAWTGAAVSIVAAGLQVGLIELFLALEFGMEFIFIAISLVALVRLISAAVFASACLPVGNWRPFTAGHVAQQLAYIAPVGLTSMIDTLSTWMDRTLISRYYSSAELATYTYGAIEIPFISIVIGSLMPVLLPHFSRLLNDGDRGAVIALWHRATLKAAMILFPLFFVFLLIAPHFLSVLYSQKYRESSVYFQIYLILLPVRIIAFMPLLFALGKQKLVMWTAAGEVVINLVVSLILMRATPLGMSGAAWGTIISTLLQASFYLYALQRNLGTRPEQLLPWIALLKEAGRAAIAGVVLLPLLLLPVSDFIVVVAAAVVAAAYFAVAVIPRLQNTRPSEA